MTAAHRPATDFGSRVRTLRTAAGLTQAELAERAGISERTVSDLERGLRSSVYPATARQLAVSLSVEGHDLAAFLTAARGAVGEIGPIPSAGVMVGVPRYSDQPRLVAVNTKSAMKARRKNGVDDCVGDRNYERRVEAVPACRSVQDGKTAQNVGARPPTSPQARRLDQQHVQTRCVKSGKWQLGSTVVSKR